MQDLRMKKLIVLVGPPGSGKSTLAKKYESEGYIRVSQDDHGKAGHLSLFLEAVDTGKNIVVDRLNFSKQQREVYLGTAKRSGYETEIIVLHEPRAVCLERMRLRKDHPTIKNEASETSALNMFFSKYERPDEWEADAVTRIWPIAEKYSAICVDLDGTMCNLDNRLHHVRPEPGIRKNWKAFFEELIYDKPHAWCKELVRAMAPFHQIVYASGRPDDYEQKTKTWLKDNGVDFHGTHLYMRCRGDHRDDTVAKEIILDYEILTRFKPIMFIDDRQRVIDLWRRRGFTALQCQKGDF